MTISDSLVRFNTATANGGGIAISAGTFTLLSSQVTKNAATVDGGGVFDPAVTGPSAIEIWPQKS